jgi:NADH-quinone oxidoreductase subunit C
MTQRLDTLQARWNRCWATAIQSLVRARGEITITVAADRLPGRGAHAARRRRAAFEQLIDLCGVDYADYKNQPWDGLRYCVVSHLLSVTHNWRVRLKVFAPDDDLPAVASVTELWNSGQLVRARGLRHVRHHLRRPPDLRRILTDYGFIGHPMRKDFPVTGHVEMRYDAEKKRVIYQPVTIEPREITPRVGP